MRRQILSWVVVGSLLSIGSVAAQDALPPLEPVTVGPYSEKIVWPISGTTKQDAPIASTFGPRQLAVDGYRHDFNRGMDIRCTIGTPVHACVAGEVRVAGKTETSPSGTIQIRSVKPNVTGKPKTSDYYTVTYLNMAEFDVKEGDKVEAGQIIGKTGPSPRGYDLLRIELRDGGSTLKNAVHPLALLPYENAGPPTIAIDTASEVAGHSVVAVTTTVSGEEMDLLRVEVALFDGPTEVARRTYDLHEWNRAYTEPKDTKKLLDQQTLNGVRAEPGQFRSTQEKFELTLVFEDLPVVKNKAKLSVKAKAVDVRGEAKEVERKAGAR
jgi:murein DD-endopeptidase MepM/ murein hydrolase activator NlpD